MATENETNEELEEESEEEASDNSEKVNWEERAKTLAEKARVSREKRKELRAGYERQLAALNDKLSTYEKPQDKAKTNEPDYARLAFLETKGIDHPDDQKIVQDEAVRLKLPLTDVLGMDHIKSRLQTNKDERIAKEGMPRGKGRSGGATANDVDYYMANPDKRPDSQELAEKVLDAKLARQAQDKFSNDLYVG